MNAIVLDTWTGRGSPLRLLRPPEWSFREGVGYESATVTPVLTHAQRAHLERSLLCLEDATGAFWWGFVTSRPGEDGSIVCPGFNNILLQSRRDAAYADTSIAPWKERTLIASTHKTDTLRWMPDNDSLNIVIAASTALTVNWWNGGKREVPVTATGRLTVHWHRPDNKLAIVAAAGSYNSAGNKSDPVTWAANQTIVAAGSGGLSGTTYVDMDAASLGLSYIDTIQLAVQVGTGYTTAASETSVTLEPTWCGTTVTTPTTTNVITHIIDTDLPAAYDFGSAIGSETTQVSPLVFDAHSTADAKIQALGPFADWHAGFYSVGGLPTFHWQPRSSAPDWVLDIRDALSENIEEGSVDDMASAIRVHYADAAGNPRYVDVTDTDPTHYLVQIGRTVWAKEDLSVPTHSSATATTAGQLALANLGRRQVKGAGTWATLRTALLAEVPPTLARPGQMVRLLQRDGYADTYIRRGSGIGSSSATLELDNHDDRLDRMLALLAKREQAA